MTTDFDRVMLCMKPNYYEKVLRVVLFDLEDILFTARMRKGRFAKRSYRRIRRARQTISMQIEKLKSGSHAYQYEILIHPILQRIPRFSSITCAQYSIASRTSNKIHILFM